MIPQLGQVLQDCMDQSNVVGGLMAYLQMHQILLIHLLQWNTYSQIDF